MNHNSSSVDGSSWRRELPAIGLLWLAVAVIYWSPTPPGMSPLASDYNLLHVHRMQFAREALLGRHTLPAWYPGQLLGTPFWSNTQNFPFLPTRLLVLMLFDPDGRYAFTVAITLAAGLAGTFTYLFSRRIGLGRLAAAAAGWTFACCGYFSSRLPPGHLPLLEVFAALPLLLWCIESLIQARENHKPVRGWLLALAGSCTVVALAGHPQLSIYALAAAALYLPLRAGPRPALVPLGAMALGIGCAAFSLVPMAMLVSRSTRVLPLARATNDLAMPYGRLAGFFFPWRDGLPSYMPQSAANPFRGYPDQIYFWDTFCYTGWTPWLAVIFLAMLLLRQRPPPTSRTIARYLAAIGIGGIVLALPFVQDLASGIPGTLLRSPARLIYLTEFSLAIALGAAIHALLRARHCRWVPALVGVVLLVHAIDVGSVSRRFVHHFIDTNANAATELAPLLKAAGDGRVAIDLSLSWKGRHRVHDIGFFDSIMLTRPYTLLVDLSQAPPDVNFQLLDGSELAVRTLQVAGVTRVLTFRPRMDLRIEQRLGNLLIYTVPHPAPRARFFSRHEVLFAPDDGIGRAVREQVVDLESILPLPQSAFPESIPPDLAIEPAKVHYWRPSGDRIECTVSTTQFGYLRIIEAWDPGWSATVDGQPAPVIPAMGALLAVPMAPGDHQISFIYNTPGAPTGMALSLASLALLVLYSIKVKVK